MRALIQRVTSAKVTVEGETVGEIQNGLLIFLGICQDDRPEKTAWLAKKTLQLRVFSDDQGKMNLNVQQVGGNILVVSQFTLSASCNNGNRPDFGNAAPPETARPLYQQFVQELEKELPNVQTGRFQAKMAVQIVNDGPVTFLLER